MRYILLLLALLLLPSQVHAQSAADVINEMIERHEQQFQNINDYTMVTNRYTTYYRRNPDGISFQTRTDWSGSGLMQGQQFGAQAYQQDASQLRAIAEHAEYARLETIDGRQAHVLRIVGNEFIEAYAEDGQDASAEIGDVYFYVDAQRYVPLRLQYNLASELGEINPVVNFSDYRQVDGMWVPYRTEMKMENLDSMMTPEEREEMAQSLAELEQELQEAGGIRRRIVERVVGGQIERLRNTLAEGVISYTIEVEEVTVNTGLGDELFAVDEDN